MVSELVKLAKDNGICYAVDIYPHYGSDVTAALSGGNNIKGALIVQAVLPHLMAWRELIVRALKHI